MPKKQENKKTGDLGEEIAAKYLKNKGFSIVERNYRKKWGEIDVIARLSTEISIEAGKMGKNKQIGDVSYETGERIHFVEVKSVSYETKQMLELAVSHETYRPEERVDDFKLNQIRKAVETWIIEHNWCGEIQIDVIAVRMVPREKYATVKYIPNVIAE
ncbi:hypothetical protein A2392_02100 [Candidatus Kaiserbacteria bacterium RIFOXYB1_FULL_46_14]|uniref:UPF0102 protein A2392_02100 n=1 Tax=Candidatus Kaiserbacteria bacterium RIFOXYB1_FULL_46_14 TaxID=1798531 RepID=A0A1F6FI58_9BACT|nr:MAG: hypothetical protein A2392_02100 [Candidatus Kaiserbacteria bacterium RIFOXYB1_FULL_46_14]